MLSGAISLTALNQPACGKPSGILDDNLDEGYRILVPNKITQNQHPNPKMAEKKQNQRPFLYNLLKDRGFW